MVARPRDAYGLRARKRPMRSLRCFWPTRSRVAAEKFKGPRKAAERLPTLLFHLLLLLHLLVRRGVVVGVSVNDFGLSPQ